MQNWSPEQWNNLGVGSLAAIILILFYISIIREWLVPGRYYRRIEKLSEKNAEAVDTLSKALAESTDNNAATVNVLTSLRESLDRK